MEDKYIGLLEISEQDLLASKVLFNEKLYPQSLFYLQQSAEKLTKYIGLTNKVIVVKDLLKSVGHDSTKIFKKSMGNYKAQFPDMVSIDIDNVFLEIKEFAKNNSVDSVVNTILNQINQTYVDRPTLPFNIHRMETAEDYCKVLAEVDPNNELLNEMILLKDDLLFKPIFDKMIKDFKLRLLDCSGGIFITFLLNTLTDKLVTTTRYPDIDHMISPSKHFNIDHPIVFNLEKFHEALAYAIKVIKNMKK